MLKTARIAKLLRAKIWLVVLSYMTVNIFDVQYKLLNPGFGMEMRKIWESYQD